MEEWTRLRYPPSAYSLPELGWQAWMSTHSWSAENNKKIGTLMHRFTAGVKFVFTKSGKGEYPTIAVTHIPGLAACFDPEAKCVEVGMTKIKEWARFPFGAVLKAKSKTGKILFRGTTPDRYLLMGIEEGHHSLNFQLHPEVPVVFQEPGCDHDTLDVEFAALQFQLEAALELKLPAVTAQTLKQRITMARLLRDKS